MNDDHVALTKCFFCGGPGDLLLATRYGYSGKPIRSLKEMHGKVVNMDPCNQCAENMKIGIILISVRNGETEAIGKRPKDEMPNPYRTGKYCVMRSEAFARLFGEEHPVMRYRWSFVEDSEWQKLDLPISDRDNTHPREAEEHWPHARCKKCGNLRQVHPDWKQKHNHDVIEARCIVCNPTEDDKNFTVVPHILELYGPPTNQNVDIKERT